MFDTRIGDNGPSAGAGSDASKPGARSRPGAVLAWLWSRRLPLLVLGVALAGLWLVGRDSLLGPEIEARRVLRADFVQSVVASGHVEAPFRVNIGAQITGIVADIPVAEGQSVKTGDALIRLDDREAQAAVVQAEGAVAQAEARLRQLRELTLPSAEEALRQAKATLTNAQQGYDRTARLAADGFATRAALDDATRALEIARAQARSAELLVFTNRPGGSDAVLAETQLKQAHANLASARSRLSYTVITAPRDGVLISRDVERGNVVQPANVLMRLSPSGDTEIVVQIDERNLGLIAVGQPALVSADAYPGDRFAAQVVFINPSIDVQRASVEVKLRTAAPPAYLRQDMTVSVDIEVATRPNAIVAPAEAIRATTSDRPWVIAIAGGRAVRRPVKTGIASGGRVEILSGLDVDDLVIPAAAAVREGARVRARVVARQAP